MTFARAAPAPPLEKRTSNTATRHRAPTEGFEPCHSPPAANRSIKRPESTVCPVSSCDMRTGGRSGQRAAALRGPGGEAPRPRPPLPPRTGAPSRQSPDTPCPHGTAPQQSLNTSSREDSGRQSADEATCAGARSRSGTPRPPDPAPPPRSRSGERPVPRTRYTLSCPVLLDVALCQGA